MKHVPLSEVKDGLSKYIHMAEEDDWFDYRLEHDPRFLQRIERARQSLARGEGVKLEDVASQV